jgi:hypothetical protein
VILDEVPDSLKALSISSLKSRILVYCEVTVVVWIKGDVDIGVSVLTFWCRL